jgi:hypothetical protein
MRYRRIGAQFFVYALLALVTVAASAADYLNRGIKEIEVDQPAYLARKNKAWQVQSRLVGVLRSPPAEFTISFINPATQQVVRKETHAGTLSVYESGWLAIGRYNILVQAEGFLDQNIPSVQMKANSDCVINLFFNPKQYKR